MKEIKLSVVIPVHNAIEQLKKALSSIIDEVNKITPDYEIIIAEDGSTDGTAEFAEKVAKRNQRIIHSHFEERLGRGEALTRAFNIARGEILLYVDVDLDTPLRYLTPLFREVERDYDISVVSKRHPLSEVKSPLSRTMMSIVYNRLVRLILKSKCYGHQGGMKCFKADVARKILPLAKDKKWFWDTEILVLGQWLGYRLKEVPIKCEYGFILSTVSSIKDSFSMFLKILSLKRRRKEILKTKQKER